MPIRSLALLAVTLAMLLAGAGGVYAFDHAHQDRIAKGVRVNGVPVGDLTAAQAEARLRARLLAPLDRPVRVAYHDRRFSLGPKRAAIGLDVRGSVARALARSQEGNLLTRTWRHLRGKPVSANLQAQVTYSKAAVRRLVAGVRSTVDRPAVDAKLDLTTGEVDPSPSHTGVRTRVVTLRRAVERQLLEPGPRHTIRVRTTTVQPAVSSKQLADRYPAVIIINRGAFRLTLYKHLEPAKTYPIAVGKIGLETPAGLYHIQNKAVNPAWHVPNSAWAGALAGKVIAGDDPSNPIKARWMGIYAGAGIHGTDDDSSIGSAASHGCIRMHIPDVEELYPQVPVGAPVYIA